MKLVVPLTIPWMRSIGVAESDSSSTRTTGTAPGHRRLEAQLHAVLARGLEQLLAVLGEQLLVGGHDVPAGAHRGQQVLARRLDAAHQLDDQLGLGEDLLEVSARAREHAADHRRAAVEALDLGCALGEQRGERRADRAVAEQPDAERRERGGAAWLAAVRHRARSDPRSSRA